MDQAQARALLAAERARLQRLLQAETGEPEAAELGDEVDDADRRNAEQTGLAVDQLLRARWAALQRAEARLAAGSYGHSVRSGQPIPDERLEADPLAELTAQEAAAAERQALEEDEDEPPPAPSPGLHIERDNWLVVKGFKPSPITIGMAEPNVAA